MHGGGDWYHLAQEQETRALVRLGNRHAIPVMIAGLPGSVGDSRIAVMESLAIREDPAVVDSLVNGVLTGYEERPARTGAGCWPDGGPQRCPPAHPSAECRQRRTGR